MPPLFAFCFPFCFLFTALGIVAVVAYAVGWGRGTAEDGQPAPYLNRFTGPTGPPSWKVIAIILALIAAFMFVAYWMTSDY